MPRTAAQRLPLELRLRCAHTLPDSTADFPSGWRRPARRLLTVQKQSGQPSNWHRIGGKSRSHSVESRENRAAVCHRHTTGSPTRSNSAAQGGRSGFASSREGGILDAFPRQPNQLAAAWLFHSNQHAPPVRPGQSPKNDDLGRDPTGGATSHSAACFVPVRRTLRQLSGILFRGANQTRNPFA